MSTSTRHVRAPRGTTISCKGWPQEAALRMLMNNLDPEVGERPDELTPGQMSWLQGNKPDAIPPRDG